MHRQYELRTGEYRLATGQGLLLTRGVGSCVVVCLWDGVGKIGGMAHIALGDSSYAAQEKWERPGLFADTALVVLLDCMLARGASRGRLSARLAGAGNMFAGRDQGFMGEVSQGVLDGVSGVLEKLGLPVQAQSVGGMHGRSVFFDVATGRIDIRLTNGERVSL